MNRATGCSGHSCAKCSKMLPLRGNADERTEQLPHRQSSYSEPSFKRKDAEALLRDGDRSASVCAFESRRVRPLAVYCHSGTLNGGIVNGTSPATTSSSYERGLW